MIDVLMLRTILRIYLCKGIEKNSFLSRNLGFSFFNRNFALYLVHMLCLIILYNS